VIGCATVHQTADRLADDKVDAGLPAGPDGDELFLRRGYGPGHHGPRKGKMFENLHVLLPIGKDDPCLRQSKIAFVWLRQVVIGTSLGFYFQVVNKPERQAQFSGSISAITTCPFRQGIRKP
jgi:hypothetical protein